jgi:hypothetical protein
MNKHVAGLIAFAKTMKYENIAEFADGVSNSIKYKMEEGH